MALLIIFLHLHLNLIKQRIEFSNQAPVNNFQERQGVKARSRISAHCAYAEKIN